MDLTHIHPKWHGLFARVPEIEEEADFAFWAVVAKRLPEIKTGDVEPLQVLRREQNNRGDIETWIEGNLPAVDVDLVDIPTEASDDRKHELGHAVVAELAKRGIEATFEYPGCVVIIVREGVSAWTGMQGYNYASVNVLVDGCWEPADDTIDTQLSEDAHDPVVIAEAWAEAIDADRIAYMRTLRASQERLESFAQTLETQVPDEFKPGDPESRELLALAETVRERARAFQATRMEISNTGYQRRMGEAHISWSSIVQAFKDAGFPETSVWQTGGGCLAIGINLKGERHAMLTTKDGVLSADRSAHQGEAWMLGLYLGEEDAMSGEGFISEVFGTDASDTSQDAKLVEKIKPYLDLLRGHYEDAYFVWLAEENKHEISGPYETPGDALADKSNYPTESVLAICDTNGNYIPLQF